MKKWIGALKSRVREGIERATETDELRKRVADLAADRCADEMQTLTNVAGPFVDGGKVSRSCCRSDVVFVTSRFRSGSTALWNAFRQLDSVTAYYEPFNERRFFDVEVRGASTDPSHLGVSDYSAEYDAVGGLDRLYDEDWIRRSLFMGARDWNPDMRRFIEVLIESAAGRPVLQFNRIDFRLPWIKANFPNASIVHLWRNPREQWCSTLGDIGQLPSTLPAAEIPDRFYLNSWLRDLRYALPFLNSAEALKHPYRGFYLIWKVSWLFGKRYGTISVAFESLANESEAALRELTEVLDFPTEAATIMRTAIVSTGVDRWPTYASADWFEEHERVCERLLDDYFNFDLVRTVTTAAENS